MSALHDSLDKWKPNTIVDSRSASKSNECGLDSYNAAVTILASRLRAAPNRASAQAALMCCQMFISIEVMIGDYSKALQHLLQGLRIMYQYRNRPVIHANGGIISCLNSDFPHLDAFAIKLFASGYPGPKHMSKSEDMHSNGMTTNASATLCDQARTSLSTLSVHLLDFLDQANQLRSFSQIRELEARRAHLASYVQTWFQTHYETVYSNMTGKSAMRVRFGTAFSLLLFRILKIVVSQAVYETTIDNESLELDFQALAEIASFATEARGLHLSILNKTQEAKIV